LKNILSLQLFLKWKRIAVAGRGDILLFLLKKGDARNISNSQGVA
jgi:hypothetical protein